MRQTEEWNCGAAALAYLLERLNIRISIQRLDGMLEGSSIDGTSHHAFLTVLRLLGLKFDAQSESSIDALRRHLPAIVNFQCEGDGHYGVAESWIEDGVVVLDHWTGGNRWYSEPEWTRIWRSARYGDRWWLHIFLDQGKSEALAAWRSRKP